ncbi:MAG: hypothetical protein COA74_05470 [Gammaproteobacteria bacterium]|nr:MAG: hypothetical protein COA74_05470 [Gammaproteobacteria bacterium]
MRFFNKPFRSFIYTLIVSYICLTAITVQAEQLIEADGFKIHYNAFNSSLLTPEVVNQYGIERSTSLGVLTLSVLDKSDKAVSAFIMGDAKNPISQLTKLEFTKITEGHSIYYIATFNFADKEKLNFDIIVVPEGITHKIKLQFKQQFYVE